MELAFDDVSSVHTDSTESDGDPSVEHSTIEWTDHTFNPWIGCTKVSPLCARCYAEAMMDKRYGRVKWGPHGTRIRTTRQYWRQPIKWNRLAEREAERRRVFCASLADVFEDWGELDAWRRGLFELIDRTRQLDWLLLTKRPKNLGHMWSPESSLATPAATYRDHVWLGTSVGTQETADEYVPRLVQWRERVPVLFLSVEPLLEPIHELPLQGIDWVIVGGESGHDARPMEEAWVLDIQRQCQAAGVAFFFKQWGGTNKKRLGRELHGQTWDAIPNPRRSSMALSTS